MKILLADDHKIIREGLRTLLEVNPRFQVVGDAKTGVSAAEMAVALMPDVVLMDIAMPDLNGIEATRRILTDYPNIKVIILSMHSDRRFIEEALKAGAFGYLLKECAFDELLVAMNAVSEGRYYLGSGITNMVIREYVGGLNENVTAFNILSSREREVLQLLAEGKTTARIAQLLNLSEKTIETHRRNVMIKLDLNTVAELTKYAIREGLTSI